MQLRKVDTRRSLVEIVRARLADSTGSLPAPVQAELRAAAALADGLAFTMRIPQVLQAQQMPSAVDPPPIIPSPVSSLPARPGSTPSVPAPARPVIATPRPASLETKPAGVWILTTDTSLIEALNGCTCVEWPDVEVWTKSALEQAVREGRLEVRSQVARAVAAPSQPKPIKPEKRKRDDEAPALVGYDSAGEEMNVDGDDALVEGADGPLDMGSDDEAQVFVDDMAIAAAAAGDLSALS